MGLVNSTGFFQYVPPVPAINSLSKTMAEIGDSITIYGENLDYVDRLSFAGETLKFHLVSENLIEFVVPENPSTGFLRIESPGINIIKNQLSFLPIFRIEDVSPEFGPSGEEITIKGKVLNSIISGDMLANPLNSDLDFLFLNENLALTNIYPRPVVTPLSHPSYGITGFFTGLAFITGSKYETIFPTSLITGQNIIINEFISVNRETGGYILKDVSNFTVNSGYIAKIKIESDYGSGYLLQNFYEMHNINFPKINNNYIKSDIIKNQDTQKATIYFDTNFEDTGYGVFYNILFTGTGVTQGAYQSQYVYGTTYDKSISGFRIQFNDTTPYEVSINYLAIKYGTGMYDSGLYTCGTVPFSIKLEDQANNIIAFNNNKEYPPFIKASLHKVYPSGLAYIDEDGFIQPVYNNPLDQRFLDFVRFYNLESPFINHSIYELNNNSFKIDTSMIDVLDGDYLPTGTVYVDYLIIDNPGINTNNFTYQGTGSYYKKYLLFTGNATTFQKRVSLINNDSNIQIIDRNTLKLNIPYTDYHINGPIILRNINNIEKVSSENFLETPKPIGMNPIELYRGDPFILQGKSFKKPILIDGTGYNEAIVKFVYEEKLYSQKNHDFELNMKILDVNTLSGNIPLGNLPSGSYSIKMMDENRKIYE